MVNLYGNITASVRRVTAFGVPAANKRKPPETATPHCLLRPRQSSTYQAKSRTYQNSPQYTYLYRRNSSK